MLLRPLFLLTDWLRQWQDRRRMTPTMALGRRGEDLAHRYLQGRGFKVVERNWRSRSGLSEVDLVAWEGGRLVLVEVKTKTVEEFGAPERNVDAMKLVALRRGAWEYCRKADLDPEIVRFDLVSVVMEPRLELRHERDWFGLVER